MEKVLRATLTNGRFSNVSVVRSRAMAAVKGKHNLSTEVQFRMALVRSHLSGWVTHTRLPGTPDFYFPAMKVAVFVDGCFWHGCKRCGHIPKTNSLFWTTKIERNRFRDQKNTRLLRKQGIHVIRAWEHSLNKPKELRRLLQRIQDILADD
ncbi:MAG: very short patch repair endonuclease [Pyrinomonadaceae bacterium]